MRSNNGNNNTKGNGEEKAKLTVIKEVKCESDFGTPSDEAVCQFAQATAAFPDSSDFPITVTGNNPNPSQFPGSATGITVTIGAGDYTVD